MAELPPGYFFPNPQSTPLENVIGSFVGTDGGSVVARDDTPFTGNPTLFLDIKGANQEVQVFGLISANHIYVMVAEGEDLSAADFLAFGRRSRSTSVLVLCFAASRGRADQPT